MPKDEFDIEYDEEVERVIKEPKSSALMKFLDYRDARKEKEREIAEAKKKKEQPDKLFGVF